MTAAGAGEDAAPPTSRAAIRVLALLLLVVAFFLLWPYRGPVVFALVTAYLAYPLYARLADVLPRRWMSAVVVLLLVAVLLVAPFLLLGGLLLHDAQRAAAALATPGGFDNLAQDALMRVGMDAEQARVFVEQELRGRAAALLQDRLVPALASVAEGLVATVVFFILLYFALVDGPRLLAWLRRLSPLDGRPHRRLLRGAGERVKALVWGSLLISLVEGVLAGLGWWVLGMPSPILWGVIMALLAVLPVVGPFVVLVPGAIYAYMTGNLVAAVGLLALNFVFVGLVDDLLRPLLVARWTRVHPAIILLGILGGVPLMGLSGLLIGPLLLSLLAPVLEAWLAPGEGILDQPPEEGGTTRRRGGARSDG